MNLLSIDTTADICSIALKTEHEVRSFHESRPREHAKILLPEIERLFDELNIRPDQLDAIVVGKGPGSFTGIRIAVGVAQGLAFSTSTKLLPLSTLQSLAYSAREEIGQEIWVALDARMSEIYFARFEVDQSGLPVYLSEESVLPPKNLPPLPTKRVTFIGNGWNAGYELPAELNEIEVNPSVDSGLPNASDSLELALALLKNTKIELVSPETVIPTYLRDNVTWDNKPKVGSTKKGNL